MTTHYSTRRAAAETEALLDLHEEIRDALIEAAFLPLEPGDHTDDELALTDRDVKVLDYYVTRGWDAFRIEPKGSPDWATLVRWSEDGIRVMVIDRRNGVTAGEVTFPCTPRGVAWMTAVLA